MTEIMTKTKRAYATRMDPPRPVRKFWMSERLHDAASGYARSQGSTMSELIREQLTEIKREPLNARQLTDYDEPSSTHSTTVSIEDELYLGAKDAAYPTRHSLTSLVRRRLLKILEREGLWESPLTK